MGAAASDTNHRLPAGDSRAVAESRSATMRGRLGHAGVLLGFGVLTVAWTWPLIRHLHGVLPGAPGDNFSFVWNLWWMRFVLAHPGLAYFHTDYLFYPFGTTIADHPHTALPAFVAATILRRLPVVAAQNVLLLTYVFLNLAAAYALAWTMTHRRLPSVLAAIVFGLAPYAAVQFRGHFDLVAAWPLPLYAILLRRAYDRRAAFAVLAGILLAATAYTAYYYVVYLALFSVVYLAARSRVLTTADLSHSPSSRAIHVRRGAAVATGVFAAMAIAIAATGGGAWSFGRMTVVARTPQNALTATWASLGVWLWTHWRKRVRLNLRSTDVQRSLIVLAWVALAFVALAAPLLWQAIGLVIRHHYVTQAYQWRNAPRGVDLLAPLLGHPLHPVIGAASRRAYAAFGLDVVEAIGWFGIVAPLLLILTRKRWSDGRGETRAWIAVAVVFGIWALGPFLVVGGFDTGLKLPATLLRYVPFVSNARMPGRAIVIVYLALSVLLARGLANAQGRLAAPFVQTTMIALIAFEYWQAPITTTPTDYPAVYSVLADAPPGAVCEVPLGIGDGLSSGIGSQDRRVLLSATRHQHPLVGGFIGRMPSDAAQRYAAMPVVSTLLALSDGVDAPQAPTSTHVESSPCRYVVVHRAAASKPLLEYVDELNLELMASSGEDRLYRVSATAGRVQ